VLSELIAEDPDCREASLALLREVVPYSVGVFVPPNWDRSYTECFGFTLEEIYAEGTQSIWTKLRTAGFTDDEITSALRVEPGLTPRERAERALVFVRAGYVGEKTGPPSTDPELMKLFFDSVRLAVDPRQSPPQPLTIQWDFADAVPWHLRVDNGATSVEQGRAETPDVTLRCRFEDWVDVAAGREDPRLAMLRGRIRPRGSVKSLWRMRNLFAR
jgi:hypothetical protein